MSPSSKIHSETATDIQRLTKLIPQRVTIRRSIFGALEELSVRLIRLTNLSGLKTGDSVAAVYDRRILDFGAHFDCAH